MQNMFDYLSEIYGEQLKFGDRKLNENDFHMYSKYSKEYLMWSYIDRTISQYDPFDPKYDKQFYNLAKFKINYFSSIYLLYKPYDPNNTEKNYQHMLSIKWRWVRLGYVSNLSSEIFILSSIASCLYPTCAFPSPWNSFENNIDIFKKDFIKSYYNLNSSIQTILNHFNSK